MTNGHLTSQTSFPRPGLTLIEILVALTMTLIVLGAMMQAFQYASVEMSKGRSMIELSNQMRVAEEVLRRDLKGLTVEPRVYTENEIPLGYFELIEGPRYDQTGPTDSGAQQNPIYSYLGDHDDILAMTVRNNERDFRGRRLATGGATVTIESSVAEIVYWTSFSNRSNNINVANPIEFDEGITLFRRVMLVRPDLGTVATGLNSDQVNYFFQQNDISCRIVADGSGLYDIVANSLSDLANRANRFCHIDGTANFPNQLSRSNLLARRALYDLDGDGTPDQPTGDDILISDIAGFDLRVFSPGTSIKVDAGVVVDPTDIGYASSAAVAFTANAFVDLGTSDGGWFAGAPATLSGLENIAYHANYPGLDYTWDTWSPEYEYDGIAQGGGDPDPATNGIDDDNQNGVDDDGERETKPPYPHPIRGLKVTFRVVNKNSKQIRQSSIVHSFVPQ